MSGARARRPWSDTGWPVLAGVACGTGLVAGSVVLGPLAILLVFAVMGLGIGPTMWSILEQLGRPDASRAVWVAVEWALGITVAVGLVGGLRWWGVGIALVPAITSPALLRRMFAGLTRTERVERRATEAARTRRAFDEIIAFGYSSAGGDESRRD